MQQIRKLIKAQHYKESTNSGKGKLNSELPVTVTKTENLE
jgi:hypothetical protein